MEELLKSYAEGIQGAFADYWDKMWVLTINIHLSVTETNLQGGAEVCWCLCPGWNHWEGLWAPAIHDLMKAVRTRAATKGAAATWKHAEAMALEDLQKIMEWSEGRCSKELFDNALSNPESITLMNLHGLMWVLYPSLFVLMLRYDLHMSNLGT